MCSKICKKSFSPSIIALLENLKTVASHLGKHERFPTEIFRILLSSDVEKIQVSSKSEMVHVGPECMTRIQQHINLL